MAYRAYLNNNLIFDTANPELELVTAKLELETGTSGKFVFTVPPDHPAYGSFHRLIDMIDVYRDDDTIFNGRVYSIEKTFNLCQKITCEGLLALLNDSIFRPVTFDGQLHDLVRAILDSHNSQVEASKQIQAGVLYIDNAECYRAYENYETSISRLQDLVTSYGGWIQIRKDNGSLYLDWYDYNRSGVEQSIDFGENLLDIKQSQDADGIITVLIPLGAADENNVRVNIKSVNGGDDYITASQEYINQYGYVVGTHIWDDVNYPNILYTKAQTYLTACLTPKITISVTAVDLADAGYDVDSFHPGQVIKVNSAPHDISGEWFECTQQSLDLLRPANNKMTLGTQKIGYIRAARSESAQTQRTLEQIVAKYATKTYLQIAQENLTQILTGNEGGFMVQRDTNNDGKIDEILFMDTTDVETARNVWRINQSGWGHSSTGIEGPYTMGATLDDAFVAKFIQAGYLNADLIRTGIIRGQTGNTYWNLNTGELHIEGEFDVDKSKVFIREPTVPYYEGDLWVTGYNENSAIAGYAIAGKAIVGTEGDSTGIGVIKTCMYTRTTGSFNAGDWQVVTNYVDADAIATLESRVYAAELNLISQQGLIEQKASSSEVSEMGVEITQLSTTLDAQSNQITALATQVTTVADKSKTFRSEPVPPYADGDTWITGTESYNAIVGYAIAGRAVVNWGRDIYVCTHTRAAGEDFNPDDWIKATKYIDDSQLYGVRQEIRTAEIQIDAANARIDLKADQTTLTALSKRVTSAEIELDGVNANINAVASMTVETELSRQIRTAQVNINGLNSEITAVASNVTEVDGRVSVCESNIIANANEISLRVRKDSVVSAIRLSSETAKIQASKIDLEGAVTITALDTTVKSRLNTSIKGTVSCYYRSSTNSTPTISKETSIGTAVNTDDAWEYVMPRPKRGCYFFTCERYEAQDGTVSFSAVRAVPNATYESLWCHSSDASYIDGGKIYANTVTAEKINVTDLHAIGATIGAFNIDSNSIYAGTKGNSNNNGDITLTTSTFTRTIAGTSRNNLKFAIGANFGVAQDGTTYMGAAQITGGKISIQIPRYYDISYLELIFNSSYKSYFGLLWSGFHSGSYRTYWGTEYDDVNLVPTNQYIAFQYNSTNYASWLNYKSLYIVNGSRNAGVEGYNSSWGGSIAQADYIWAKRSLQNDSDRRIKKNIKNLEKSKATEFIYQLKPSEFEYKDFPERIHHGLIAQDVQEAAYGGWKLVSTNPDGNLSLAYTEIIADLIATVQSLNERIVALEARM